MQFTGWECIYTTLRIALNYFKKETVVCCAKFGRKHSITVVKISIP